MCMGSPLKGNSGETSDTDSHTGSSHWTDITLEPNIILDWTGQNKGHNSTRRISREHNPDSDKVTQVCTTNHVWANSSNSNIIFHMTLAHDHAPQYHVWLQKVEWFRRYLDKAPTYGQSDRQIVGWIDRQMWWFWYFPPPPEHCYGGWGWGVKTTTSSWEPYPALPAHFFLMNQTRSCSPECWQRHHDRFHTASCLLWASAAPQREFPSSLMAGGLAWRCPVGTEATGWAATRNKIQHELWHWLHRIQHDDDTGYTGYNMILATQDTMWYWLNRIEHDTGYNILWYKTDNVFFLSHSSAQWLQHRTRDWKVAGLIPCWSGGRIFFSRVDFLCWLLFWYLFHPRVTTVARKRSRSFCQKCRWQVTAKHAYTLRMWLCMKWRGAWLYGVHRTCAETAAVSCGTSHASAVSTLIRWIFKKTRYKASHSCRTTCERSESAQESGE